MTVMMTCVLMQLGRRLAARAICLSLQIGHRTPTFTISPTSGTTGYHLGFERDSLWDVLLQTSLVLLHHA